MTKGLWVYCPSPMFSKTCTFLYFFTFFFTSSVFGTISFPRPSCHYFFLQIPPSNPVSTNLTHNLNLRVVPSSAVFCSIIVLIITPSSSMHFLSFFDVLPIAPTTTGMTLTLLMFHILLISLFNSWYLSIYYFSFPLTLMSPGIAIFTSLFSTTPSGVCSYHFSLLFRLQFPHNFQWTILATLSCFLLYSFCANFSHSLTTWDVVSLFVSHILKFGDRTVLSILCFTQVVRIACSSATHNIAFVSNFKSPFLNRYHVPFLSVVSSISLTNCPWILLFFHSWFFSLIQLCLNSFVFTVSLYSIVSAAFITHNLSIPFFPFPLADMPISLLGCSAPCIVKLSGSSV